MTPTTDTTTPTTASSPAAPGRRWTANHAVLALTVAVTALGLLNLWSALLARGPGRAEFLRDVIHLPLLVAHGSRTLIALFGLGLLMLARSLARRKRQAWRLALLLVGASPFLHLTKGLDWEEALVCLVLLVALWRFRHAFLAENDHPSARQGMVAALGLLLFAACYGPAGFLLLRRDYRPHATFSLALAQTGHRVLFFPESPVLRAHTHRGHWFDDSLQLMSVFAAGYAIFMLLRPVLPRGSTADEARSRARSLLQSAGGAPVSYFTLLPDKRYLFEETDSPAWVAAYVVVGRQAIVLGDPLGPQEEMPRAISAFVALCRRHDWQPAFYQITAKHLEEYRRSGLKALKVGEDAVIDLTEFSLSGKRFQDLRTAINKMGKIGVVLEEIQPTDVDADTLAQLAEISEDWLRQHKGEEKTFALGRFDPNSTVFHDSRLFLARQTEDGTVMAFVTWVPIYGPDGGWGLDLMRRRAAVPNGVMEFLIASSLLAFQREGAHRASLGLSPLSDAEGLGDAAEDEWVSRSRALLFQRFNYFYSFKGLHGFKEKFGPCWEPRYLIYDGAQALAPTLYAVLRAHSPRGLWTFRAERPAHIKKAA